MIDPQFRKRQVWQFRRPAEPTDLREILDFINSENEASLLALLQWLVNLLFVAKYQTLLRIFQPETSSLPG